MAAAVRYWELEASSFTEQISDAGDAVLSGGTTMVADPATTYGNVPRLDHGSSGGTPDLIDLTGAGDPGIDDEGSYSFWFYRSWSTTSGSYPIVAHFANAGNSLRPFIFYWAGGGNQAWRLERDDSGGNVTSGNLAASNIPTGEWHFATVTWSVVNDRLRVYVDASQIGSDVTGLAAMGSWTPSQFGHGRSTWSGTHYAYHRNVSVFDYELSASEVSTLYSDDGDPTISFGGGTPVSNSAQTGFEASGGLRQSAAAQSEALQFVARVRSPELEANQGIRSSSASALEALQSIARPSAISLEAVGAVAQGRIVLAEALQQAIRIGTAPVEALSSVQAGHQAALEALQSLAGAAVVPFEALGQTAVANSAVLPIEALMEITVTPAVAFEANQDLTVPATAVVEALSSVSGAVPLTLEAITALSVSRALNFESLGGQSVSQSAVIPLEARGRVSAAGSLAVEGLATVSQSSASALEVLESTAGVATLSHEALQAIAVAAGVPFEALLNPAAIVVTNVVDRTVYFQVRLDRDVVFGQVVDRDVTF